MRKTFIAGNWKLNPVSQEEAKKLATGVINSLNKTDNQEVAFCVPVIYIPLVKELINNTNIKLGAQNIAIEEQGAFTGEISPLMLKDYGVEYIIIGHSERRTIYNETDSIVATKMSLAQKNNLKAILCVGETEQERQEDKTDDVIKQQLKAGLAEYKINSDLVIAYEPVWAIGTGKTCSSEEANRVCELIRAELASLSSQDIADNIIIQYGGSVKSSNSKEIISQEHIDGALVGGASLKADEFTALIHNAQ